MTTASAGSTSVPRPWTPITTESSEMGIDVGVWGRSYRFGNEPLPTAITSAGMDILAGPIEINTAVAGIAMNWKESGVMVHRQTDAELDLSGWKTSDELNVSTSVHIEFDGMMRVNMVVTPHGTNSGTRGLDAPRLDHLWVDIPLNREMMSLYNYWPVSSTGVVQTGGLKNSGAIPADGLAVPFKPYMWLGWEEGGFTWFAESQQGWQAADENVVLEVLPREKDILLRVHLMDSPHPEWRTRQETWAAPLPPLTFTFGFQATPVKALPADFHEWRINHTGKVSTDPVKREAELAEFESLGVKTLIIHEKWNPIQNYPGVFNPDVLTPDLAAACHAHGMKLLLYFGYEFSTMAPEWAELWDKVLVKNTDGGITGGWDRKPAQRAYIVCYGSEWQDRFMDKMERLLADYDIDGVYLDGTAIPWGCANTLHGCGCPAEDGTMRVSYPLFAVRRMMRRLYQMIDAKGGYVNAHQSSCCFSPVLAFAHSYWDGEQLGGKFDMNLATFRAEFMGKNYGVPCDFLSPPESLALTLIHDVRPRPHSGDSLKTLSRVWDVMTRFGVGESDWFPYWRNAQFVTTTPDDIVKASFYSQLQADGENRNLLLVVSNVSSSRTVESSVKLDITAAELPTKTSILHDALSGEEIALDNGKAALTLKPLEFRMLWTL